MTKINRNHFFKGDKKNKELFKQVIDLGFDFMNGKLRGNKFVKYKPPEFFKERLSAPIPTKPIKDYTEILKILKEIGEYSISQSDPGYLSFPDAGNAKASLMGEVFSKFINQNLIAFDRSAPIATFIEIQLIEWLREMIGFDHKPLVELKALSEVSGMWTTGGHMSNHMGILAALNDKYPHIKEKGLSTLDVSPKIILAGKIVHYSFGAAMHHLGLGNENIIKCKTTSDYTTDISDLEKILSKHKKTNDIFMIACMAGNTRTSSLDDIETISRIAKKYGIWLHVDACHGGSLLFSKKLKKKYLRGIEKGDSITLDPHKGMFVTYPASYIIFKKRDTLTKFTRYEEAVRSGSTWELGFVTPFLGSRGFESLKMWLLIKTLGKEGLAEVVEERHKTAQYVAKLIDGSGYFQVLHDMTFYRMAFVFLPTDIKRLIQSLSFTTEAKLQVKNIIDSYTHEVNQELYEEGNLCLDEYKLHDIGNRTSLDAGEERFVVMGVTVGNPLYTREGVKKKLGHLFLRAKQYSPKMKKEIMGVIKKQKFKKKDIGIYGPAGWK